MTTINLQLKNYTKVSLHVAIALAGDSTTEEKVDQLLPYIIDREKKERKKDESTSTSLQEASHYYSSAPTQKYETNLLW